MGGRLDAEPLILWEGEFRVFADAYRMWVGLSSQEENPLDWIEAWLDPLTDHRWPGVLESIGSPSTATERSRAGWILFNRLVSENLERHKVGLRLYYHKIRKRPALRLSPSSLIGAIWLQLAQAADRGYAALQCPRCGQWFARNPKSRGRQDTYCSTKCRVAFSRKRKKARAMAKQGSRAAAIAKAIDVEPATVRTWIRT